MRLDDADNLLQIFSDPIAMTYYPSTKDRAETIKWIEWTRKNYASYGIGLWVAELKENGVFVGQCGLVLQEVDGKQEVEIGYSFVRKYWGLGLATECAIACRDYGFDKMGYERLVSIISVNNIPSIKVAERVGMTLEKEIIKWNKPVKVYAITKD
jgi:RimJ/RimL family protein N-acetyltransferase